MRFTVPALACTVAGTLALLALPATATRADSTATLPQLTGFHQMVVDSANGYVFLSEGISSESLLSGASSSTAIVVTDLTGTYITTLDAGDGVEGLALSSDGNTLYAALAATEPGRRHRRRRPGRSPRRQRRPRPSTSSAPAMSRTASPCKAAISG